MKPKNNYTPEPLIQNLSQISSSSLADAMDRLGLPCGCIGIKPVASDRPFCGRAFTVHYVPCSVRNKGTVGDFIDEVEEGQVIVVDNAGRENCSVWGDLMTYIAVSKNIAATVIDGACRDIPEIRYSGYPVYAKGAYMLTGKSRVEIDSINQPVSLSDIQVRPGDIIRGDDTGVIVIPQEYAEDVLRLAHEIEAAEKTIIEAIQQGRSFKDAISKGE